MTASNDELEFAAPVTSVPTPIPTEKAGFTMPAADASPELSSPLETALQSDSTVELDKPSDYESAAPFEAKPDEASRRIIDQSSVISESPRLFFEQNAAQIESAAPVPAHPPGAEAEPQKAANGSDEVGTSGGWVQIETDPHKLKDTAARDVAEAEAVASPSRVRRPAPTPPVENLPLVQIETHK